MRSRIDLVACGARQTLVPLPARHCPTELQQRSWQPGTDKVEFLNYTTLAHTLRVYFKLPEFPLLNTAGFDISAELHRLQTEWSALIGKK